MRARRVIPVLLVAVAALATLGAWFGFRDHCGAWDPRPPRVEAAGRGAGPLRAGAARAPLNPPYPVPIVGYGPPKHEARSADPALEARALVLEAAPVRVAIASADLVLVSPAVAERVRARTADLGLSDVWVVATHTHSSMGGYDPRDLVEWAGTGSFREEARDAVVEAMVSAIRAAHAALAPAQLAIGSGEAPELVHARSGDSADARTSRVRITRAGEAIAEVWLVAAHPTLVRRDVEVLSPDYPGLVDRDGGPVVLVLQGAVGNASATVPDGDGAAEARFARALEAHVGGIAAASEEDVPLAFSRVSLALPRPDASRLVPKVARTAGDNLLCESADREAEVRVLRLGGTTWIGLPLEPTATAARQIEAASGARPLALVGGYLGYVEDADAVRAGTGEAKRQYFGPELVEHFARAAAMAAEAVRDGASAGSGSP